MSDKEPTHKQKKEFLRDGDNPYEIGGRDTDIAQIGYTLDRAIINSYKMNHVPNELVKKTIELNEHLKKGEELIQDLITEFTISKLKGEV